MPFPTPAMFKDPMLTGMHATPSPVAEKKGTANGSSTPVVVVLNTEKFVGLASSEMRTAAMVLRSVMTMLTRSRVNVPVHWGCSLLMFMNPPVSGNGWRSETASLYPSTLYRMDFIKYNEEGTH